MTKINKIVKEVFEQIKEEHFQIHSEEKIKNALEQLSFKLNSERGWINTGENFSSTYSTDIRLPINEVSDLIAIPVNHLKLYFLNVVKNENHRSPIEYHLGHVYFYR